MSNINNDTIDIVSFRLHQSLVILLHMYAEKFGVTFDQLVTSAIIHRLAELDSISGSHLSSSDN